MNALRLTAIFALLGSLVGCGTMHACVADTARDKATADSRAKRDEHLAKISVSTDKTVALLQKLVDSLPPPRVKPAAKLVP